MPSIIPESIDPQSAGSSGGADACANCDERLAGPFCFRCGQSRRPPTRSLRELIDEALDTFSLLDLKSFRSFRLLLTRPGYLTAEYLSGHRVRYTRPLQVYLASVAAFFLANAFRPFVTFDPDALQFRSSLSGAAVGGDFSEDAIAEVLASGRTLELFSTQFESTVTGYLPTLLIASVLLLALLLKVVFRASRFNYLEHAVFALHWTAFYFLLMIGERILSAGGLLANLIGGALSLWAAVYLVLAVRRVYGLSTGAAVRRGVLLFVGFQLLIVLWLFSAYMIAIRTI